MCIEKKKSVCLKYANVVLLLYDALNLTDNFLALLWWSLLPRVTAWPALSLLRTPLPSQTLWEGVLVLISLPLCSIFKLKHCKNEYNAFPLLSIRSSLLLSFPPLGIIANLPDAWALLSYLHSQVLFKYVVTIL